MTAIIDPRVPFVHIREVARPSYECWKVEDYEEQEQSADGIFQAGQAVMWAVIEKNGIRVPNLRLTYGFPTYEKPDDTDTRLTDSRGLVNFGMGRDGWDKSLHRGVYWMQPTAKNGDVVEFMGLDPDHHHRAFVLRYRWNDGSILPPPPPPPPPGGPDLAAIAARLRNNASDLLVQAHLLDGK